MKIKSTKLVYFSPTGTTKAVVEGVAQGIDAIEVERIDLTKPESRLKPLHTGKDELLIIGVPVYMGRVPEVIREWLQSIKAKKTPVVCIIVYGNRVYDDALLELTEILVADGCLPIASGAFIGEHSFSSVEIPIAAGRPNIQDLSQAEAFGCKINEKLAAILSVDEIGKLNVPGEFPFRGATKLWNVDFIAVGSDCNQCQICAEVCPVGAISKENSRQIDQEKCITCCACIKKCPLHARTIKLGPVHDASIRLNTLFKEPKQPDFFY
ncbi:ferredoxin [Acetobacterium paludosum]|uniref:Ferredoxin n=1 Tax=Acetobacterium paludosum TaxID=52693 RepID=A0A923HS97_9FIRM|nr:EFR1 family ferrodoxin [Acetobacterium paludosum]MBC3887416.1 ferredoxin [Acetobacterium paludosum]